jgi:hypothetical protein
MTFTPTHCRGVTYGREPYHLYTYARGGVGLDPLKLYAELHAEGQAHARSTLRAQQDAEGEAHARIH